MNKSLLKKLFLHIAIFMTILLVATLLLLIFKIDLFMYMVIGYIAVIGLFVAKKSVGMFDAFRKPYYLFCCKMFFAKSHPEINFSEFTGSRLEKIIRLNARRRDLDAPRLSEQELDDLCRELDMQNLALVGKAVTGTFKAVASGIEKVNESLEHTKKLQEADQQRKKLDKVERLQTEFEHAKHFAREVELGIKKEANYEAGVHHEALAEAKSRLEKELKSK